MATIRPYHEADAESVGRLIVETYSKFNLSFATPEELGKLLGPFRHAWSAEPAHRAAIAEVIRSQWVFVAEEDGEIVGVLRGRKERLGSLFVRGDHHRQGIGRRLVEQFEQECAAGWPHGDPACCDALRDSLLRRARLSENHRRPQRVELRGNRAEISADEEGPEGLMKMTGEER